MIKNIDVHKPALLVSPKVRAVIDNKRQIFVPYVLHKQRYLPILARRRWSAQVESDIKGLSHHVRLRDHLVTLIIDKQILHTRIDPRTLID